MRPPGTALRKLDVLPAREGCKSSQGACGGVMQRKIDDRTWIRMRVPTLENESRCFPQLLICAVLTVDLPLQSQILLPPHSYSTSVYQAK
jgi:hypothetical protein